MMKQTLWEFQHWRSSTQPPFTHLDHLDNDNRASDHAEISAGTFLKAGRRWKATFESSTNYHSLLAKAHNHDRGWALQKWMSKKATVSGCQKRHQTRPATQCNQAELPHQAVPALFSPHDFHQMQVRNNPDIAINWCMWYTKMTIPWMTLISGNVLPEPPQILAWVSSRQLCTWEVPVFDFTWDLGRDLLGPLGRGFDVENAKTKSWDTKSWSSSHQHIPALQPAPINHDWLQMIFMHIS